MYKKPRARLNLLSTFALGVPHKQEEVHNLPVVFPTLTRLSQV